MTYLTNMIDNNNNNNQNTARLHLSCNSMVAANTTMSNDSIHSAKYTENAKTFREVHLNSINSSKQPTESMSTVGLASKLNYPLDNQHYHQHHHHWTHQSQPTNHHHHHHNHHQAPTLLAGPSDNHLSHFDYFQSNYNQNVHEYHQPYVGYNNNTNSNNNGNGNNDATYQTETTQNNCYLYSHPYSQNQPTSSATTNYSGPHGHSHSSVNYLTYIDQPSQVEQSNLYYNNNPSEDNQHITGPDYRSPLTYNNPSGHALTRQPEQYVLISPSTHASKYYHNYTSTSCVGQSTCLNRQELGHVSVGEDNSKAKVAPETAWTANFQGGTINTSDSKTTTTTTSEIPERHQVVAKSKSNVANAKSSRHVNGEATIIQQTKPTTTTNNQSKSSSNSASSSSSSSIRSSNQCHVCGRNYARPSTLKTHLRTHTNERPFKCNVCFKTFSQAANLTAHQRVHTGERPFSCPICGRQFSQSSSVITHLRTHSGERPYKCNMCSRTFSDSSTLTKHCRIHSGEKPYQCDYCPLNFSQSGNLSRHLKLHLMGSLQASSSSSNSSSSSSSSSSTSSSSSSTSAAHRMLTVT